MGNTFREDIKNARKCDNVNDPIDNYVWDYVAMPFTRTFIKLHVIPNVVTVLSGIVGVLGGVFFCLNTTLFTILGIIMVILSVVFDESDGQVARLTKKYSNFGRTLDGFNDFCVYFSIYVALCVRLFNERIPFTDIEWGFWIIPVAAVALWFFGAQARTLDYYKNLHMFMVKNGGGKRNELSKTKDIKAQLAACKKFSFERFRLSTYHTYTKIQENETPKAQKLLNVIERNGDVIPEPVSDEYKAKSKKYIMLANALAFNLRTFVLFVLLLLPNHFEFLYFAFVIFVLEPIRIAVILKYEKLAAKLSDEKYFTEPKSDK